MIWRRRRHADEQRVRLAEGTRRTVGLMAAVLVGGDGRALPTTKTLRSATWPCPGG